MILNTKKEIFFFYKLPLIIFSLIPFLLITGPFLSDLGISLIAIIFLIYSTKKRDFSFFKKNYFYFFLVFWIYLVANSLFNNFNTDSIKISFFYIRFIIFGIASIAILDFNSRNIKYFFYCLFVCFVSLTVDGFYQYFFGENIFGIKKYHESRVSSFFGEELILGSYLSRLWPIFFALTINLFKLNDKKFILFLAIFILSEVLIFLSGDRTAFFYINLSAIFIIFFANNIKKIRFIALTLSFVLIIVISIFNPQAKERVVDYTLSQLNITSTNKNSEIYIFSKQHTHHYITAYKMFEKNILFGVGVKNFRNYCDKPEFVISNLSCSTHPHNSFIQVLSEIGLIGFSFLIFLLSYFIYYLFKHVVMKINRTVLFSDFEICLLSGVAIFLWPLVPTGNFFNNWLNITYYLYIPFLIWSVKNRSHNK